MAKLKMEDINLGAIEEVLTPEEEQENAKAEAKLEAANEGKVSQYESDLRAKIRRKKQFNLGLLPEFIVDEFDRLADKNNMSRREFFYHLLREKGANIPKYDLLDGRKL